MFLDDIGDKLVAAGIGLTLDDNLFLGRMPEQPPSCVSIIETPGLPGARTMGATGTPEIEIQGFQIISRDTGDEYQAARIVINQVWSELASTTQEVINSVTYHQFVAQSSPFSIGPDEEDQIQIACNFLVWKDPTP